MEHSLSLYDYFMNAQPSLYVSDVKSILGEKKQVSGLVAPYFWRKKKKTGHLKVKLTELNHLKRGFILFSHRLQRKRRAQSSPAKHCRRVEKLILNVIGILM